MFKKILLLTGLFFLNYLNTADLKAICLNNPKFHPSWLTNNIQQVLVFNGLRYTGSALTSKLSTLDRKLHLIEKRYFLETHSAGQPILVIEVHAD